jgi:acetyl esterase/lipase
MKLLMAALTFFCICSPINAQSPGAQLQPDIRTFKTVGTTKLSAHIFRPEGGTPDKPAPVIVLFHGGGWNVGSPEWVYGDARRYAGYGAVAVAAEYRLSDWKKITPLDAIADARDLVLWLRANSKELGIDSSRLAAYGFSAGGHLAAALATIPDPERTKVDFSPQALVMLSPAVSLAGESYFEGLLLGKTTTTALSPDEQIHGRIPPTIIFQGVLDTTVPICGVRRFCAHAREYGSDCQIIEYPLLGHLLSRKLDEQTYSFDPDPKAVADSIAKGDAFLAAHGFLPGFRPKEHKEIVVDSKILDRYVGRYQLMPDFIVAVTRESDHLFAQATGQQKVEIFPESEYDFFLKVNDLQMTFVLDNQGHTSAMIMHQNGKDLPAKRIE